MSARDIVEEYADRNGWDDESIIVLLCDYVENQQSNDALEDYLREREERENE
jgi:hypothetical protein